MLISKKIKVASTVLLGLFIILSVTYYYFSVIDSHFFVGELTEIKGNEVTFQKESGDLVRVNAPQIIIPLLRKNDRYSVVIHSNNLRTPFLKEIKNMSQ